MPLIQKLFQIDWISYKITLLHCQSISMFSLQEVIRYFLLNTLFPVFNNNERLSEVKETSLKQSAVLWRLGETLTDQNETIQILKNNLGY